MKGVFLLLIYPRVHKAPFPGSYLRSSFIVFVPIFAFYALVFPAAITRIPGDGPPPSAAVLIPFFLFAYVLFSVLFAAFLGASHTWRSTLDDLRRKKRER